RFGDHGWLALALYFDRDLVDLLKDVGLNLVDAEQPGVSSDPCANADRSDKSHACGRPRGAPVRRVRRPTNEYEYDGVWNEACAGQLSVFPATTGAPAHTFHTYINQQDGVLARRPPRVPSFHLGESLGRRARVRS